MPKNPKFKAGQSASNNVMMAYLMIKLLMTDSHVRHCTVIGGGPAFSDYIDHGLVVDINCDVFSFPQVAPNKTSDNYWVHFKDSRGSVRLQKLLGQIAGKPLILIVSRIDRVASVKNSMLSVL